MVSYSTKPNLFMHSNKRAESAITSDFTQIKKVQEFVIDNTGSIYMSEVYMSA